MNRRGITLIELLIAMVCSLLLIAATAPIFMLGNRGIEQQRSVQEVQSGTHIAAEVLIREIRATDGVRAGSDDAVLFLEGGPLAVPCGDTLYRIEFESDGIVCGPDDEAPVRRIAENVGSVRFEYGVDLNDDGSVDDFRTNVTGSIEDDVLAVRFHLTFARDEGQRGFETETEFVAVIRNAVLSRFELGN